VEIGCGNGYFLRLLAEHGARCTGYDAGYDGSADGEDGLTIHRRFYDPDRDEALDADLLVCRHVLEHIPRPGTFLRQILRAVRAGGAVYIEVPDAMFTLSSGGVWDLIYEHCNYFTESALGRLCRGHDLVPTRIVADYGDQFLCLDAGLHGCRAPESTTGVPDPVHVFACAERFATEFHAIVDRFAAFLADELGRGRRIALWGAGSKGVTFLNVVPHASEIQMVIDLNPRKHGRHVAGTAQKVSDPDSLCREFDADLVLVMNPNYTLEVEDELRARGSRAQVLAAV
jgi:SAM-dependent methyltransferase